MKSATLKIIQSKIKIKIKFIDLNKTQGRMTRPDLRGLA